MYSQHSISYFSVLSNTCKFYILCTTQLMEHRFQFMNVGWELVAADAQWLMFIMAPESVNALFYSKKAMIIDPKYRPILLEALEDLMYKLSLQQEKLKGKPLTADRKEITNKQNLVEELQHQIST